MVDGVKQNDWYVAQWPLLAWLETVIKLAAIVIGIVALISTLVDSGYDLSGGFSVAEFIVLGILCLGLTAAIFDRLKEREIVAMLFVLLNNVGHWGMLVAIAGEPGPGWKLVAFCALFLGGDLVKMLFIRVHHFTIRDTSPSVLYGLTMMYVIGYAVLLLLELIR